MAKQVENMTRIFHQHIPIERVTFPPLYSDNVVNNMNCKAWTDELKRGVGTGFRDTAIDDYFRIGDCVLKIPPQTINIKRATESQQIVGLRLKDSLKIKSGYHQREIRVPISFNGLSQINGYAVPGPNGTHYVDGLRPLIAQIKKTPFLPVENYLLNIVNQIFTVVVGGLNISTVEGYPTYVQAELILYEFSAQPYIGLPNEAFTDMMDWDLFRWYYQRSLFKNNAAGHEGDTWLQKIESGTQDFFKFTMLDENVIAGNNNDDESNPLVNDSGMKMVEFPDDIQLTQMQIGIGNIIKNIQLSHHSIPTTQYLGSMATVIACTFETKDQYCVAILNQLLETSEMYARNYRDRTCQGYVGFHSPLSQLFGVNYVMIESCEVTTDPDFPGNFTVSVLMTSFDKTQPNWERPKGMSPVFKDGKEGTIDDLLTNKLKDQWRGAKYDQFIEDMLDDINLYPDLELPKIQEVSDRITIINKWRTSNGLIPLPYTKHPGDKAKLSDPDFYFCYPTLEQAGLSDILNQSPDWKQMGEKIGGVIDSTSNGWYINHGSAYNYKPQSSGVQYIANGKLYDVSAGKSALANFYLQTKSTATVEQIDAYVKSKVASWESNSKVASVWKNQAIGKALKDAEAATGLNAIFLMGLTINESAAGTSRIARDKYNFYGMNATNINTYNNATGYKDLGVIGALLAGAQDVKKITTDRNQMTILSANQTYAVYLKGEYNEFEKHTATKDEPNLGWTDTITSIMSEFYSKYSITQEEGTTAKTKPGIPGSPVNGIKYRISDTFGPRTNPATGQKDTFHDGIDIAVAAGTNCTAILDGVVSEVLTSGAMNTWRITINHAGGISTSYLHIRSTTLSVGDKVKKGQVVAKSGGAKDELGTGFFMDGNVKKPYSTGPHLHFKVLKDGNPVDPEAYLNDGVIDTTTRQSTIDGLNQSPVDMTDIPGIAAKKMTDPINYENMGKPLRTSCIKSKYEQVSNNSKGLVERMCVDMVQFNKRGTMCRAFPSYLMLFVDEGIWLDGRRLWSNYYAWHSVCEITVEKDRRKPADTAMIKLTNIYNALGTNPKVHYGEQDWNDKISAALGMWTDKMLTQLVDNKNRLLKAFNVKAGARMHIRMGYGSHASALPIAFNGIVAEVDMQDVVTVICQGDGYEFTTVPMNTSKEDKTNGLFVMGRSPESIITYTMTKRSSDLMFKLSSGKWFETSAYGIEHFGNLYYKNMGERYQERFDYYANLTSDISGVDVNLIKQNASTYAMFDENVGASLLRLLAQTDAKITTVTESIWSLLPFSEQDNFWYENMDLVKNIYLAGTEMQKTQAEVASTGAGGKPWWKQELWGIKVYLYNRSPWDVFQVLASSVPEFICQPHSHQFHSTLFFGMPHWNVRYKYEYVNDNEVYQLSKPYAQFHILNSLYDIVDDKVRVVAPPYNVAIPTYAFGGDAVRKNCGDIYADRAIKSELQKTVTIDTNTLWDQPGSDDFNKVLGYNPGYDIARRIGIAGLQGSFREMYQGNLLVLGDVSIKPCDIIYIDDAYAGLYGTCEVGNVVHHMGIETGFVTDIKPDLCVAQTDVEAGWLSVVLRGTATIATAIGVYTRASFMSTKALAAARNVLGLTKVTSAVAKDAKVIAAAFKGTETVTEVMKIGRALELGTGIRKVISTVKGGLLGAGIAATPETLGTSLVAAVVSYLIMQLLDDMFTGIINYIENQNVLKIYPLWYKDKPYVAGINGHKNLIPGYQDSDFYPNYNADDELYQAEYKQVTKVAAMKADAGNYLDQAMNQGEGGMMADKLKKYNDALRDKGGIKDVYDYVNEVAHKNPDKKGGTPTYRTVNDRHWDDSAKYRILYTPKNDATGGKGETNAGFVAQFMNMTKHQGVHAFADGIVKIVRIFKSTYDTAMGLGPTGLVAQIGESFSEAAKAMGENMNGDMIYGTHIAIEHYDEKGQITWITIYANLLTSYVPEGAKVKGGQVIGVSMGPHVSTLPSNIMGRNMLPLDVTFQLLLPGNLKGEDVSKWMPQVDNVSKKPDQHKTPFMNGTIFQINREDRE